SRRAATPVTGVPITRPTGTAANTSACCTGNASQTCAVAPYPTLFRSATNPTGSNHVLTITVNAINGTLDAGQHTATASIVSGPGSFVGSPSCTYTGGAATASCQGTITSSTPGTTAGSATAAIPVNGATIT